MLKNIQIVGKFYDNHSLSIVNRNLASQLSKFYTVKIVPIDAYSYEYGLDSKMLETLDDLKNTKFEYPEIEIRHSYPPIWLWPEDSRTKVVYIQPWEYSVLPLEWYIKFDRFADSVIVPSVWTQNVLLRSGIHPNKVYVVPNGYNEEYFYPEQKQFNKIKFLFVGCNQFRKGLDVLLEVWSKATNSKLPISLTIKDNPKIYGNTDLLENIIKLQYKSKCATIMYDDSQKSEKEMGDLYREHHILVHPYRGEGFGMHVQEAMACGCMPIVTKGGPTDSFVLDPSINSSLRFVNLHDIKALKPEDSTTGMGSHKTVLEPDKGSLAQLMQNTLQNIRDLTPNTANIKTWSDCAEILKTSLEKIYAVEEVARFK